MAKKSNDVTLKEALTMMLKSKRMKSGLYKTKIEQLWKEKMGNTIAQSTSEIRVYKNKLYLTINSAPIKNELTYSKAKIIKMVNQHLQEEFLEDVIIR